MHLTFSASIDIPDANKWLEAMRKEVQRVFIKAAQKFLLAAVPRIPIWTGFARGAFRNLEDVAGKVSAEGNSFRIRGTRGGGHQTGSYRKGYYYYPPGGSRVARTPQTGRDFATDPSKIFDFTGVSLASGRTAFYFRFKVDITYFDYLDQAKWHAFQAGVDALEAYIRENLKVPDPLTFTTRKTYKTG